MRRFAVFGLLGPCIGLIVFTLAAVREKLFTLDVLLALPGLLLFLLLLLPFAFYLGFVPALLTAACDAILDRWDVRPITRYALTGIVGYVSSYAIFLRNLGSGHGFDPSLLTFGLTGLISAVICAWLSDLAGRIHAAEASFDTRNPAEKSTPPGHA